VCSRFVTAWIADCAISQLPETTTQTLLDGLP
jgi:hypothetical protein